MIIVTNLFGAAQTRLTLRWLKGATLVLFAGLLAALTYRTIQYLIEAWRAVSFPFELERIEGDVWQQAALIPGPQMYGPVDAPPFLFFEYPLVYHLAVNGLTALGGDPLKTGRALSVSCALIIAGLCGFLVNRAMQNTVGRPARVLGMIVATLIPLTYHPVTSWSQLMRVDMLAIAFSFIGVTLVVLAVRRPALLWIAMAAFVFGIYTKQVEMPAAAAALAVAFIVNKRHTAGVACAGIGVAAAALLVLEWATDGGFLRHIVLYNASPPFSLGAALFQASRIYADHIVYFALALVGFLLVWIREIRSAWLVNAPGYCALGKPGLVASFLRGSDLRIVLALSSLWFVFASVMLVTSGQDGAMENHFIEAMCIWAIPIGILTALTVSRALGEASVTNAILSCGLASLLAVALLLQVRHLGPRQYGHIRDPAFAAANEKLIAEVRSAPGPVYSEDMVISMRSGRGIAVEPPDVQLIFLSEGWNAATGFARMIEEQQFAFLILRYESVYPEDVLSKIRVSYPITEQVGPYVVRRPRAQ